MAYVLPTEEEENEAKGFGGQALPKGFGGQGAATAAASTPSSGSVQQDSGSGYISFDRYLNANRDGAKAQADKLASGLQSSGQKVKAGLAGRQQAFGSAVTAGSPPPAGLTPPQTPAKAAPPVSVKGAGTVQAAGKGTPQPAGMPTGNAPIPPGPSLQQRAAAAYKGPGALSEGDGWAGLMGDALDAQGRVGATGQRTQFGGLQGDAGIQALLDENSGPKTGGMSRMDAALVGSTGRGRFEELKRDYGDLFGEVTRADDASKALAGEARGRVQADAASAQGELDSAKGLRAEQQAGHVAANDKEAADRAAYLAQFESDQGAGKAQTWDEYHSTNRAENTLRTVGGLFDPVNWASKAGGGRGTTSMATEAADGALNKTFGTSLNATKFNWGVTGPLGNMHEDVKKSAYESLSKDELHALERMGERDASTFLAQRIKTLGKKAADAINKVPLPPGVERTEKAVVEALVKSGVPLTAIPRLFALAKQAQRMGGLA